MSHPDVADFDALIEELIRAGVEFVVVGGVAAVMHGSGMMTKDLDIVHRRIPENVDRLMALLQRLDAFLRYDLAKRQLPPTREMLMGDGQINLSTTLGPLDPLCSLEPGQGYEEILEHTETMSDEGLSIRVLDLPTLIAVKEKVGRPKDLVVAAALRVVLAERDKVGR